MAYRIAYRLDIIVDDRRGFSEIHWRCCTVKMRHFVNDPALIVCNYESEALMAHADQHAILLSKHASSQRLN